MDGSRHIAGTVVLGIAALFTTIWAHAQTAAPRPNPPPQICVNGICANTPVAASPPPSGSGSSGPIKWNPGHYMASFGTVYGGKSTSFIQYELNDLNNQDAFLGYRMAISWAALEPTQGNYDFSAIDAVLATLKTFNKPKRLVIMLWDYGMGTLGQNDHTVIPTYIQQNSIYGASPVSGSYGWWGENSNGASTGQYALALYYPPVMDRFIAMVQALGQHLDSNPYVEAILIQEDATVTQSASEEGSADPHYSDDAWLAQLKRLLTAATAAFPHTSVSMANSWMRAPTDTVALEEWMSTNRIAAGSADTVGQSAIDNYGLGFISWGLQAHIGVAQYGGVDLRPKMAAMMDVEYPDMVGNFYAGQGGPYAPLDIIHALNQTYHASHAFWTRMVGSAYPAAAQWSALAATCTANPLTSTAYPANYPK